jgi:hypothetical protein
MQSRPDSALPYFTSRDLGSNTGDIECVNNSKGCLVGIGILGVDQPVNFVFGEACMQELPIFTGCKTNETTGPIREGFDRDSGSNIGIQLTRRIMPGGRSTNLNRTCITKVLPNPAVNHSTPPAPALVDASAKKSKQLSFDQFNHKDDHVVGIN